MNIEILKKLDEADFKLRFVDDDGDAEIRNRPDDIVGVGAAGLGVTFPRQIF